MPRSCTRWSELQAEAAERMVWTSHDSRWNAQGAFVGYRSLLDAIPARLDVQARRARGHRLRLARGAG